MMFRNLSRSSIPKAANPIGCPRKPKWEYAARSGGKKEKWAGTSTESELGGYAWYDANSDGTTHPVGQKKPNGLGLYDMTGNVWEWCSDWYGDTYYGESSRNNHGGPSSGSSALPAVAAGTVVPGARVRRTAVGAVRATAATPWASGSLRPQVSERVR